MNLALVDIVACSVVGTQFEARIAAAFVGAPIIDAAVLAQTRILLALVHVHAFSIVASFVFKTSFAVASIRTNGVNAFGIGWARTTVFVKLAFVDVFAVAIVG